MTMRTHVVNDFPMGGIAVYVVNMINEGRSLVMQPDGFGGTWVEHDPQTSLDVPPTIRLPEDVARALLDSLARHFGGVSEVQTLRVDYLAERGRVDKLTDALIRQTDAYVRVDTSMAPVAVSGTRR